MRKVEFRRSCIVACLMTGILFLPALAAESGKAGSSAQSLLGQARYRNLPDGRFMSRWLLLGPVPVGDDASATPDDAQQEHAFDMDTLRTNRFRARISMAGKEYEWTPFASESDTVNLAQALGQKDHVIAYAWARVRMPEARRVLLGIGSDDAVKVWLNGELIHENWVQRPCTADSDLVPVTFRKGRNHLVLKVQNGSGDWGFSCRVLGPEQVAERLVAAARGGQLDSIDMLLEHGADVNATVNPGLTALHMAAMAGRTDAVDHLRAKGANDSIPMPAREKIVDWLFERVVKEEYPGVAALIARDGEVLCQRGYGRADVGLRVPATPETKFRIGSVTKQFTAAAILKLQEEEKLNVSDKLSKFLPDFPRGDEVTLHHLLTHTSGIHSYTSKSDFMKTVTVETTPEELVNSFKDDKFDFDPGESQLYCNSGYFLLGCIVEKVSGKSLGDYLKNTFFDPLKMNDTGVHRWNLILDHEATGYSYLEGKPQKAQNWDMSRAGGAGALYSTVGDLCRWNTALFAGKVLTESSLEAAFTPATLNNGEIAKGTGEAYGYGWGISQFRGMKVISHGGGLHGFSSFLMQLPEKKTTVAVLANCLPGIPELSVTQFAHRVAEIYLFEEMEQQTSFRVDETIDPAVYDDYVGRYDYAGSLVLTVTKENDRLFAQLTGQSKAEIFPRSPNEFFWKDVEAQVAFVRDEVGKVTETVHRQGGRTIKAPRLKEEVIAEVDPDIYDAYAGKYKIENVGTLDITREGNHLYVQLGGQPKFELFPRTQTEFFLKVVQADIIFTKDEEGKVTGITLKQAGAVLTGERTE